MVEAEQSFTIVSSEKSDNRNAEKNGGEAGAEYER